jgi:SAM-dependent methyltransferase
MRMTFKDYFSDTAHVYAATRPDYPLALFEFLKNCCPQHELAWDCATGNGQAALGLSHFFKQVIATEASSEQLLHATQKPNIEYRCETAENTSLQASSADLLTVAQAVHWFDLDKFYAAARSVLKPQGVIALWCYQACVFDDPAVNALVETLYWQITRSHWAPERDYIDEGYASLPFPFTEIKAPEFSIERHWTMADLISYLHTWSGLRNYLQAEGDALWLNWCQQLQNAWGASTKTYRISWPIKMRIGRL